ncbi:MAG TPA: lysophospholipid acyltransferase family protein [Microthrixaceae bacterium]|nr:lysophospholipid acyltransferase family protein [Microthrixaceae bacterium]
MKPSPMAMRPWQRAVYRALRALFEVLCRIVWRMEVEGRERLPATGPYVIAPVHRSNVDFAVVGAAVPRVVRFMAKDAVWKVRIAGWFVEQMGSFPVNRDQADRAALRRCEESLAQGDPVVMFPEGKRREGDTIEVVLDGPAWVACRNRVPIVPVGLGGTDRAMPIGAKMIRAAKVRVLIGEPIYPDVPLTGRVPRGRVAELSEQLRNEVQKLYDEVRD